MQHKKQTEPSFILQRNPPCFFFVLSFFLGAACSGESEEDANSNSAAAQDSTMNSYPEIASSAPNQANDSSTAQENQEQDDSLERLSTSDSPTTVETQDVEPIELTGMLDAHNATRAAEGVDLPELTWSQDLTKVAQTYAEQLAQQKCPLTHSGGPYGENLYWSKGIKSTSEGVVESWASEIQDYDYATNQCSGVCGHYTQIVWRDTKEVGCGTASCAGGEEVWVCNYDPPGNWRGEKPY